MATPSPTVTKVDENLWRTWIVSWTLGNADTGVEWKNPGLQDKSVQVAGTFGSATVTIEGSNDGTNWATLHDPTVSGAATFTSAGLKQLLENTLYIRAKSSGGTGTSVTVTLLATSFQRQG